MFFASWIFLREKMDIISQTRKIFASYVSLFWCKINFNHKPGQQLKLLSSVRLWKQNVISNNAANFYKFKLKVFYYYVRLIDWKNEMLSKDVFVIFNLLLAFPDKEHTKVFLIFRNHFTKWGSPWPFSLKNTSFLKQPQMDSIGRI
jgi:hypothetical protein